MGILSLTSHHTPYQQSKWHQPFPTWWKTRSTETRWNLTGKQIDLARCLSQKLRTSTLASLECSCPRRKELLNHSNSHQTPIRWLTNSRLQNRPRSISGRMDMLSKHPHPKLSINIKDKLQLWVWSNRVQPRWLAKETVLPTKRRWSKRWLKLRCRPRPFMRICKVNRKMEAK